MKSAAQAVISAGGTGTRLQSHIGALPKVLVELGGKSLLERHFANLEKWGIKKVLLLLGNGSEEILELVERIKHRHVLRIEHSIENHPLGTGGSILEAKSLLDECFLFFHGDLFINMPMQSILRLSKDDADFSLFVHPTDHPEDSDLVEFEDKRITQFITKPHSWEGNHIPFGNSGVYYFKRHVFDEYVRNKEKIDLDRELIPSFLNAGHNGLAVVNRWEIRDIGTPARLSRTESELQKGSLGQAKRPAILLDRDGTLNISNGYITSPTALELFSETPKAIKSINDAGVLAIVITNQPVIARGDLKFSELKNIHFRLESEISKYGARIQEFYVCPHHPDSGFSGEIEELKISCQCRKPAPGLIMTAIKDYGIDTRRCVFIGDSWRDEKAASAAGLKFIRVEGNGSENNIQQCINKALLYINQNAEQLP